MSNVRPIASQRKHPRQKILKQGRIVSSNPFDAIAVTIHDICPGGARISLPASTGTRHEFGLAVLSEQLIYPARECWRKGENMGLQFIGEPYAASIPYLRNATPTWQDPLVAIANPVKFPGSITNATDSGEKLNLHPQFRLRFKSLPAQPERGLCLVDVLLRNNSAIVACFPFFCIPMLGLNATPARGWVQQDVAAVRKIRRFARLDDVSLEPGTTVHCCTISLAFRATDGGCVEFEVGSEHPLDGLPDFKLMCIVGAGNYSSERIPLTVPADAIKALIELHLKTTGLTPATAIVSGLLD